MTLILSVSFSTLGRELLDHLEGELKLILAACLEPSSNYGSSVWVRSEQVMLFIDVWLSLCLIVKIGV